MRPARAAADGWRVGFGRRPAAEAEKDRAWEDMLLLTVVWTAISPDGWVGKVERQLAWPEFRARKSPAQTPSWGRIQTWTLSTHLAF